jgi:hypothetical protein
MSADKRRIVSHAEKKARFRTMNPRQTNEVKSRVPSDPSILDWISIGVKNGQIDKPEIESVAISPDNASDVGRI